MEVDIRKGAAGEVPSLFEGIAPRLCVWDAEYGPDDQECRYIVDALTDGGWVTVAHGEPAAWMAEHVVRLPDDVPPRLDELAHSWNGTVHDRGTQSEFEDDARSLILESLGPATRFSQSAARMLATDAAKRLDQGLRAEHRRPYHEDYVTVADEMVEALPGLLAMRPRELKDAVYYELEGRDPVCVDRTLIARVGSELIKRARGETLPGIGDERSEPPNR